MAQLVIDVETKGDAIQDLEIISSVQALVKNLNHENLLILAKKSQKSNINKKIQNYKNLM